MIFLVVLYHSGGVYESTGLWEFFWLVDDPVTNNWVGIINTIIDIFVIPVMFFVSGFFTPISVKHKPGWVFLVSRFKRLIIPWIIAVLTLIPLFKMIFLHSRNLPQQSWTEYFHFSQGIVYSSQNWLWFLPVLFLFNILYYLFSKLSVRVPTISLKTAIISIFLISYISSVIIGILFGFREWTVTPLIDFENERILMYFLVFILGALCYRLKVFNSKPKSRKLYITAVITVWIPILIYMAFLLYPIFIPGGSFVSPLVDFLIIWFSFYLSLLFLMYLSIQTFWRYLDSTGKIRKELNRNSYGVYIIHVIVLGVIALLLLGFALSSMLKFVILALSTFLVSNFIISFFRFLVHAVKPKSIESRGGPTQKRI
jgi:hypothetical protein